jgi:tRNA1(Val) A37 N6-methylase TrmN6
MDTEKKIFISNKIKNISINDVDSEMDKLINIGIHAHEVGPRSRIGNNIVDYFTFTQRLETKGKYDTNFFEFLENIEEFKKKKFIQTMLQYYKDVKNKNGKKNEYIVLKEVYNICISAINIMRPLNCMEIYTKYKAKRVLNFCAGWGGSTVAAAALNLDAYYGIEINKDLEKPYENMIKYLKNKSIETQFEVYFLDAVMFDYSTINYDTVFASPPYYFLEKYANNMKYKSKKEMDELFYKPLFTNSFNCMQKGGHYIINICKEVYDNVLIKILGQAHEVFPLKKSKRQNDYTELVYVWIK